ncbi:MAG: hypothetical protein K9M17_00485 [Mariprofundaceae bacterium]|nr:hypothetical protein [Mariprofundaceae bacterium]
MQKTLIILMFILALIILATLIASLSGSYILIGNADLELSKRLALLPSVAISAGVLVAILTFSREKNKQETERQRHESKVFLERASHGFAAAIDLLSDQNNDRVTWIRASRTLLKAVELKNQITTPEYQLAYELEEEQARNELYIILSIEDQVTGERKSLPPQFFYGISDWASCKTLDEAAVKASNNIEAYSVTIDEVPPQSSLKPLARRSITAIFDFIEDPENYTDPLDSVEDWDENWDSSFGINQGARRYVAHTKQKHAVDGKLHEYNKASES